MSIWDWITERDCLKRLKKRGAHLKTWKVVLGYGTQPLSIVGNEIGRFEGGWRDSAQPICMREKTYLLNSILIARVLKVCAANLTNFVKRR